MVELVNGDFNSILAKIYSITVFQRKNFESKFFSKKSSGDRLVFMVPFFTSLSPLVIRETQNP